MKTIILSIICVLTFSKVFSQSPSKISYQAVIRDSNNELVKDQAVGIRVSILQNSVDGNAVYVETHSVNSNGNGLVSLVIGSGIVSSGEITQIDWNSGPFFIKTEIDPDGAANYIISGTTELLSVPYALHSNTAQTIIGSLNEQDPVFLESVAFGILESDTSIWNNKLDSYAETDPVFSNSLAHGITESDTSNWNNHPVASNASLGDILFHNGSNWVSLEKPNDQSINYVLSWNFNLNQPFWKEDGANLPSVEFNGTLFIHPTDNSDGVPWALTDLPNHTLLNASSTSDGRSNTDLIVASQGAGAYGSYVCDTLIAFGFDDWYLPSKDELNAIFLEKDDIGGFSGNTYQSSSEGDQWTYWGQSFSGGFQGGETKEVSTKCRCVRRD